VLQSIEYGIIYDYVHRAHELESLCFYEYVSMYKKVKKKKSTSNEIILESTHLSISKGRPLQKRYNFLSSHRQYFSHEHVLEIDEKIPVLNGPSFPRRNDSDNYELYSKMILLLFKPWRDTRDVKLPNENYSNALTMYLTILTNARIFQYIENIEFLKKAEDDAKEEKKALRSKHVDLNEEVLIENNIDLELNSDNEDDNNYQLDINLLQHLEENSQSIRLKLWESEAIDIINKHIPFKQVATNYEEQYINNNLNAILNINNKSDFLIKYDNNIKANIKFWEQTYKLQKS
jgi:hypothetical protein